MKNVVPLLSGLCGFRWEIHWNLNWCSPVGSISLFAFKIYSLSSSQKFNYDMSYHGFLWVCPIWVCSDFWRVGLFLSLTLLGGLQPWLFSNTLLSLFYFSYPGIPVIPMFDLLILSCRSLFFWTLLFFQAVLSLELILSKFCWSVLKFAESVFCHLHSTVVLFQWAFYQCHFIFQFYYLYMVLFCNFYFFVVIFYFLNLFQENFQLIVKHFMMAALNSFSV